MPLVVPIHGGLVVGATVKITATPLMNAERFAVNFLRNNANRDHLLHGAVIRNSCLEGVWQKEERQINQFPFILGVTFDMIEINGREFTRFTYRGDVPMKDVDRFELSGDIAVQMVQLNNIS
ncbi:unnamed protein product [Anisakis simplex]|uniref:Galectin n=1 Tax=Anisakis simplex TaxID=6269 RepID=A0A0M3J2J5_ANISI|nr:unnamed protein product [Anisakis simplex]